MFTKPSDESGCVRWSVLARVTFVLAGILILIAPPQRVLGSFSDCLIEGIVVVAFALTLVAIAGLHALQSGRYRLVGSSALLDNLRRP